MEESIEEWRVWNHPYEVSNMGRVRNIKTSRILSPHKHHSDSKRKHIYYWVFEYYPIPSHRKRKKVHQMVGEVFLPPCPGQEYCIDHINGNRDDNRVSNLQWLEWIENSKKGNRDDSILLVDASTQT